MASSDTNSVEELIHCVICHEPFDDPRLLPCSHTYCRKCIEKMASANKDQFECPLRDGILVVKKDIGSLPLHQDARDLVEIYGSIQHSTQCTNCQSATAEYGCDKCENECFCSGCYQTVHTPRVMQKHQRIPVAEKSPEIAFCERHSDERLKYWCEICHMPICSDCKHEKHNDHQHNFSVNVAKELQEKINKNLKAIQTFLDHRIDVAQTLITAIDNHTKFSITKIKETMSVLHQMIDDHEKTIVEQILTINTEQKKQIEDSKVPLRSKMQSLNLRKAMLDVLLMVKDHTRLLKAKQGFDNYVNQTNETLEALQMPTRKFYHLEGLDKVHEFKWKILRRVRYIEYSNPELEKLVTDNGINERFRLISKKLTDQDMIIVADALRKNMTLTHLSLDQNQIGDLGAQYLSDVLKQNKTLSGLSLYQNQIGNQGAQHLADALKHNRTLSELYLHQNQINDQGAQHFADALKQNKTLTHLALSQNPIGDQGAQYLADVLRHNKTLKYFNIRDNRISQVAQQRIKEAPKMNTELLVVL